MHIEYKPRERRKQTHIFKKTPAHRSNPRPASSTPTIEDPPRSEPAAFAVGDAAALELAAVTAVAAFELDAALALEVMVPGAVRILVGTVLGVAFVTATTIPPAAVEAICVTDGLPSDPAPAAPWPVLRTE